MTPDEFRTHLKETCKQAGGQRLWGASIGVSSGYVSEVIRGKRPPSEKMLKALNLKRVVSYEPAVE